MFLWDVENSKKYFCCFYHNTILGALTIAHTTDTIDFTLKSVIRNRIPLPPFSADTLAKFKCHPRQHPRNQICLPVKFVSLRPVYSTHYTHPLEIGKKRKEKTPNQSKD